ncbi:RNA polymerase II mediator complex subunit [Cryomyces antarcticus]|nr:RNA polymerase II mediator complex subunit [Cryomyces antarcticus]
MTFDALKASQHKQEFLRMVGRAFASSLETTRAQDDSLNSLVRSRPFLDIIKQYAVEDVQVVADVLEIAPHSAAGPRSSASKAYLGLLLHQLLRPGSGQIQSTDVYTDHDKESVEKIVETANNLSLPFCQLELMRILKDGSSTEHGTSVESHPAIALVEATKASIEKDQLMWQELISVLDNRIKQTIREYAETRILSAVSELAAPTNSGSTERQAVLRRYLNVVDHTASDGTDDGQHSTVTAILEKMKMLVDLVSAAEDQTQASSDRPGRTTVHSVRSLLPWIHALLRLAVVHKYSSANGKTSVSEQVDFLCVLSRLLVHPKLQSFSTTAEYVFDVAAIFSDDLPDDAQAALARHFAATPTDPRLAFLFGCAARPDAWLALVSRPALAPKSSFPPTSQPAQRGPMGSERGFGGPQNYQQWGPPSQQQQYQQQQQQWQRGQRPCVGGAGASGVGGPGGGVGAANAGDGPPRAETRISPFALKPWEVIMESAPLVGDNDTALSLRLFGARKVV